MTAETLAAAILRDVRRFLLFDSPYGPYMGVSNTGGYLDAADVLAALSRAMSDDLAERAGELVPKLRDGCNLQQRDGERAADLITALLTANAALRAERDDWKAAATARHPNPADHRYWEGRYRDEKARAERLEAALEFYRNGFERKAKRSKTGVLLSVEYVPTNTLLEDCGNRAIDALKGADHE